MVFLVWVALTSNFVAVFSASIICPLADAISVPGLTAQVVTQTGVLSMKSGSAVVHV